MSLKRLIKLNLITLSTLMGFSFGANSDQVTNGTRGNYVPDQTQVSQSSYSSFLEKIADSQSSFPESNRKMIALKQEFMCEGTEGLIGGFSYNPNFDFNSVSNIKMFPLYPNPKSDKLPVTTVYFNSMKDADLGNLVFSYSGGGYAFSQFISSGSSGMATSLSQMEIYPINNGLLLAIANQNFSKEDKRNREIQDNLEQYFEKINSGEIQVVIKSEKKIPFIVENESDFLQINGFFDVSEASENHHRELIKMPKITDSDLSVAKLFDSSAVSLGDYLKLRIFCKTGEAEIAGLISRQDISGKMVDKETPKDLSIIGYFFSLNRVLLKLLSYPVPYISNFLEDAFPVGKSSRFGCRRMQDLLTEKIMVSMLNNPWYNSLEEAEIAELKASLSQHTMNLLYLEK